jgi:hypothetical protein
MDTHEHHDLTTKVINMTIDTEAAELLYLYGGKGRHNTGRFLSRLLREHHIRKEKQKHKRPYAQHETGEV